MNEDEVPRRKPWERQQTDSRQPRHLARKGCPKTGRRVSVLGGKRADPPRYGYGRRLIRFPAPLAYIIFLNENSV